MPELGDPLASGRTAEIYPWGDGQVLKLFRQDFSTDAVLEEKASRLVCSTGLPCPAVGELVLVNGRWGLVFERLDGSTLFDYVLRKPWFILRAPTLLAGLHARMHANSGVGLPAQRASLMRQIKAAPLLSTRQKDLLQNALLSLPDGDRLCHGDFHPQNIIMASSGPVIIDWVTAVSGSPLADVTRTSLLLRLGEISSETRLRSFIEYSRRWIHEIYLRRYFSFRPADRALLAAWEPVLAAARMAEGIESEQDLLLQRVLLNI